MGTTTEGVEDTDQLGFLRRFGCHRTQGYYFARPVPPDAVPPFLARSTPHPTNRRSRRAEVSTRNGRDPTSGRTSGVEPNGRDGSD